MMILADNTGDTLRRASKLTAALQIYSVGLLVVLIFLYSNIAERQKSLRDGIGENAMWAVYQLDTEARELAGRAQVVLAQRDSTPAAFKTLSVDFDLLHSRMALLKRSRLQTFFIKDKEIFRQSEAVQRAVFKLDPYLAKLDKASDAMARLQAVQAPLQTLKQLTNQLLLSTNSSLSENRTKSREDVARLEKASGIYLLLLLFSVGFLIFTLRRQLKTVRQAGLGFESMANALSSAYDAADAGNRTKSQFMATMGHEIRTPLNAILGTAELLELSKLPPEMLENVQTIRSSGEALLDILNEILDYSKIEHGRLEIESRPTNMADLTKTVMGMMRGRAAEHGDELVLDMPERLERPWVKTDPTRLRQIILNLMSNAIKFTSNGKVTLRLREILDRNGLCKLRIEVQDSGIGIDEEGQKRLFKPFSQVDASISRRYGGTGLGLTISMEIVKRLGGGIGVYSQPGYGSTFWLEIPAEPAKAPDVTPPRERPTGLAPLPPHRVLLVEDNKVNQQIAMRFLERLGQKADLVNDGAEAVDAAAATKYDVILMDMQMPVMDGIQATHEIRNGIGPNAQTRIVAMTANASDEDRQACREAGMNGFEPKPISLARLHAVLKGGIKDETRELISEPVSSIGIDSARKDELIEALGADIFAELVQSFFNDAHALLRDIEKALGESDLQEMDKALHTLKGAAANVGFKYMAEVAQRMRECPPADGDFMKLSALIADQEQECLQAA